MEILNKLKIPEVKSEKNCLTLQKIQKYIAIIQKVKTTQPNTQGSSKPSSKGMTKISSKISTKISTKGSKPELNKESSESEEERINKFIYLLVKLFSLLILLETITEEILPFQNSVIDDVKKNDFDQSLLHKLIELREKYEDKQKNLTKKISKIEKEIAELFEENDVDSASD